MERIQVLIDKLQQQNQRNESVAQMLVTVQLLQNELATLQKNNKVLGTSKVAVVLPSFVLQPVPVVEQEPAKERQEERLLPQPQPVMANANPPQIEKPVQKIEEYIPVQPVAAEVKEEPVRSMHSTIYDTHFEVHDAPTLIQQQIHKEVHELISDKKESLNDRLRESKKELAHVLKEVPIKDLRKAIGVNDKFTYINELFRGDEAMYERSIKTINSFRILPEAEYWMNRELKVKLGWNDSKEIVQHFYQLVRRRFS